MPAIRILLWLALASLALFPLALAAAETPVARQGAQAEAAEEQPPRAKGQRKAASRKAKARLDHSGRPQRGKASYYAPHFAGKKMANGKPMNPNANVAASKTLPLGTKARVKNLRTGKSTEVRIEDRGPYVDGRIVDLSPKAADQIGMKKDGVAPVQVDPITVPQPDGSVKPGAGGEAAAPAAGEKAVE